MTSKTTTYSYSSSSKSSSGGGAALSSYSYSGDKDGSPVVIKNCDMVESMQEDAIRVTEDAFEHNKVEKDIAAHIKKKFDEKHGTAWHCIVGRNFGSYVTHETNHFIYVYKKQVAVLLFKSG